MFAAWKVGIVFTAANMTGHAFSTLIAQSNAAQKAVDGTTTGLTKFHAVAMAAFATVGVVGVAAFVKVADAAGKYQLQMSLLQQQLGASDAQMDRIGKKIVSLSSGSSRTMFGMSDLSLMARSIQQSGLDAGSVERLLTPVAFAAEIEKLRHGGHLDPGTFAGNISATIKGLGLGAPGREEDARKFANQFTAYASISKQDSAGMLAYENQFGLISRQAGWKADDFLTAGALFSQMGVKPQMVGTMMKNIVTNLTPRATLTGHAETAQFMGLMNMGMLNPANPADAKKYLAFVQSNEKKLGLPQVDPSKMTAKQQGVLGGALLRGAVSSAAMGKGLDGLATLLHNAYLAYEKKFGKEEGDARFARDARNVFNLRGLPAALALAQGGPAAIADIRRQAAMQVPLDVRAAALRGEYEPMKEMLGGMINSVMVALGGVTAGGRVTAGSPLDIMTHVLAQVEILIGKFVEWGAENPKLVAQLGTLIGVIGVGGLVASAGLAMMSIVALTRSLWVMSGAAGMASGIGSAASAGRIGLMAMAGGAVGGAGRFLGRFGGIGSGIGRFFSGAGYMGPGALDAAALERIAFAGRLGASGIASHPSALTNTALNFGDGMKAAIQTEMKGGALGEMVESLGQLSRFSVVAAGAVGRFALGISNIVGWVFLAVQALQFFHEHPAEIGAFLGNLGGWITYTAIPSLFNAFKWGIGGMFSAIGTFIADWVGRIGWVISHPAQAAAMFLGDSKTAWSSVRKAMTDQQNKALGGNSSAMAEGMRQNNTITINVHANDPAQAARDVVKELNKYVRFDTSRSGGSGGLPGVSPLLFGAGAH